MTVLTGLSLQQGFENPGTPPKKEGLVLIVLNLETIPAISA
jgi:hypothetical protein